MSERMIYEIRTELARIDLAAVGLWLLCALPYALGWLVGFLVRCVLWMVAAVVAGYKTGKG